MWEKIKAFFANRVTKIVEFVILGLVSIGLIIGGATLEDVNKGALLAVGIADAIALFAAFISSKS